MKFAWKPEIGTSDSNAKRNAGYLFVDDANFSIALRHSDHGLSLLFVSDEDWKIQPYNI